MPKSKPESKPQSPESKTESRQRGRPPVSGDALAERQAGVLSAAGQLLAEKTSSDITVEQLIQVAGTSRPTFYRWFPGGIEQVVEMLIARANQDLIGRIVSVVAETSGLEQRIEAGVRAYFEWARDMGPVTYGIYREGFDEASPAWRYRQQTIATVVGIVRQQAEALGFAHLSELSIETLVSWIESAGATLFRHYPVQAEQIEEQRWLTTEMFLAMIDVVRRDSRGGVGS
ncbi:MAG: TetR/AcrR family transcriptional regulator [Alcanivoracaceae bacterium]|nr:TetR/AcrR family transcriptional regulator [Alcanivoracaceae bacterium]